MPRIASILQQDETDCAAAALATVALRHGRCIGVQRLREICGTDESGTSLRDLASAAERLGFTARAVRGTYEVLTELPLPAIAHVTTAEGCGHFVVLQQIRRKLVVVSDPRSGLEKLPVARFREQWDGYLLLLVPDPGAPTETDHGDSPATPWRAFLRLLRPHRAALLEAFVASLFITLLAICSAAGIQMLVDSGLLRGDRGLVTAVTAGLGLVIVFQTVFNLLRQMLLIHVGRRVDLQVLSVYVSHLLRLPVRFFQARAAGDVVARLQDAEKIRDAVSGTALAVLVDGLLLVLSVAVMYLHHVALAAVASIFLPLLFVSALLHHRPNKTRSRRTMESAARLQSRVVEDFSNAASIRSLRIQRHRSEGLLERVAGYARAVYAQEVVGMSMGTIAWLVPGLATVVVLWMGGLLVLDGELTVGQLMFFSAMLAYAVPPLQRLATADLQIQEALVAVDRIQQILELDPEQSPADHRHRPRSIERGIELRNVTVSGKNGVDIVRDIALDVPAGDTVALVGPSGSGKTTILNLLVRFQAPTRGSVTVDGIDCRDVDLDSLRRIVALVTQNPQVFAGTLWYNLTLHRPGCALAEVEEVLEAVSLRELVDRLPDRYDTRLGEQGMQLSAGQLQRLALARALLANPQVLLLDEATSHLDPITEHAVLAGIRSRMHGRTVVMVAHRLVTIAAADTIYVLKDGCVVESGPHQRLLDDDGFYAALWHLQFPDRAATVRAP